MRERELEKLQGQAAEETVPDVLEAREWYREQESSTEASPQTARYKARSTQTAAFSRKIAPSNKQRKEKTDPHSAERLASTIQNSGSLPRAMPQRKS